MKVINLDECCERKMENIDTFNIPKRNRQFRINNKVKHNKDRYNNIDIKQKKWNKHRGRLSHREKKLIIDGKYNELDDI